MYIEIPVGTVEELRHPLYPLFPRTARGRSGGPRYCRMPPSGSAHRSIFVDEDAFHAGHMCHPPIAGQWNGLDKRMTSCYIMVVNIMSYIMEGEDMVQRLSDAELEIMKIVWGDRSEVTLFPYIMDGLAARGKPCQKNTLIVLLSRLMNKGFLSAKKIGRRNEYTALVSEKQYQTAQTRSFLDKIYEGSAKGLVSDLIMGDLLTDEEYEELKGLLEKGMERT